MQGLTGLPRRHWIAGLLALAWAAFALHACGAFGGAAATFFDQWVYTGLLVAAAVACLARALTATGERLPWLLMAAGIGSWTLGDVYWAVELSGRSSIPTPSIADTLYLGFYPLAYAALVMLVRRQAGLAGRDLWIDGVIGASCVTAVAVAVAFPAFHVTSTDTFEMATNLAYPVLDVVLLSFVIVVFGLSGWRPGRRWTLIGVGLAAMAVSDGVYLVAAAGGSYAEGGLIDTGWPAAALLVALAAWQPAAAPAPPRQTDRRLVVVPVFCGLIALTMVALGIFGRLPHEAALPALLTLLLVTGRMGIAFVEGQHTLLENRRDALTDGLTGLGNRRKLLIDLERAVARSTPDDPCVCVLLDLDGFKAYNDAFGHPAGDELLTRLGMRLADVVRDSGTAYRLGGDEFCLLVHGRRALPEALAAAARAALAESGEGFSVTSSAGVVVVPPDASDPAEVLQIADRRMYADKGRRGSSAGHQSRAVLLRILREREPALHEHLIGVAELAVAVGRELEMNGEQLDEVARAAELHDIGKIAIPEEILHKPGELDRDEWAFVKRHTIVGERILGAAPALRPVARLVRSTHERYDGSGYPDGLRGEEIPLGSRIVSVCDAFEAMISPRPYRPALSIEQAVAELRRQAGAQFDPRVVEVFTTALERLTPEPLSGPAPQARVNRRPDVGDDSSSSVTVRRSPLPDGAIGST
jgi:two-component system, cell cycle response regulator